MLGSIDGWTDRIIRRLVLFSFAACLGLAAFGVSLAALYHWLALWMSVSAALVIVALLLAIGALGLAWVAQRQPRARAQPAAQPAGLSPSMIAAAGELVGDAVRADPLGAMLGAGAMGFILESRPDLDHALLQQILRQFAR